MINFIKKIHKKIPLRLKKLYMPLVSRCSYHLQRNLNLIYPSIFLFEGVGKDSGLPLKFAYAGFHMVDAQYWGETVLAEGFQKQKVGRVFFWNVTSFLKKNFNECHFLLMEHTLLALKVFPQGLGFRVPKWVNMEIDITGPLEKLLGYQRKNILRRIRKHKLSHEMTTSREWFDDFYYNMFLPYIRKRYGPSALIGTYEELLEIFLRGGLILVKMDGEVVSGSLFDLAHGQARMCRIGVRNGDYEYVKRGVLGAKYYFLVSEMKKMGYDKVFIGGTRPVLTNGVTKYKMSLKAGLESENRNSCLWLTFLNDSVSLRSFLVNNPFFCVNAKKEMAQAIFKEVDENVSVEDIKDAVKKFQCPGVKEARVYIFGDSQGFLKKTNGLKCDPIKIKLLKDVLTPNTR